MRLHFVCALVLPIVSVALSACGGGGGGGHNTPAPPAVTASVTVTSPAAKIYEGDTVQLVATAKDAAGNVLPGKSATWSSDKPQSFPVSASGELKTWGTGAVTVTASIDGVTGSLALAIVPMEVLVTVGAKEVVLDYTTDRCPDNETPDGPARFVRAQDGSLVLFDGRTYINRGADFASIARDCNQPALVKALRPTPDSYENAEMIWSVYREGDQWHVLVHNEFHDPIAATCQPGNPFPGNPCWYNSVTYAVSTDGARSFSKPGAPAHTIAPAPYAWVPPAPGVPAEGYVEGYFNPSNIVQGKDGYYYAFLMAIPFENWNQMQGLCVFRTRTLGDPASWRAWDGSGFDLRMTSPYVTGGTAPICAFLGGFVIPSHLVYDTYLERYMAVATSPGALDVDGRSPTCGIFYALSADLVHWSKHRLLVEASMPWCAANPSSPGLLEPVNVLYPSIVDHADTTVNFEKAGRTPYLYYVRFNGDNLDRDLMRVPLTLTRTN
ncbi:MAG: Ig-like domain-containing protein [Gammaproteobacteria bacterium]|nr:Ig-like domain-containing protein [Gammaproteobacteria bacterium]